jgi:dimethylargininase
VRLIASFLINDHEDDWSQRQKLSQTTAFLLIDEREKALPNAWTQYIIGLLSPEQRSERHPVKQMSTTGLMRRVAGTYAAHYQEQGIPISQERAESQFEAYAQALRSAGLEVHFVEADDDYYDCVFIEDTAIVWPPRALVGRLARHREGEQQPVEARLGRWHETVKLSPDARLEGGDVLHIEQTTYVGLTKRTNDEGIEALREFMRPFGRRVVKVPVDKSLHLKSAATYLGNGTIIVAPDLIETRHFEVEDVIFTDRAEHRAANCLRVREHLLIPEGCPATEKRLREFADQTGLEAVLLDISEFEKGDGSMTCLSIIW